MTDVKRPAALADQAAESIRGLNHATLSARDGWEYPSDAYDVVGDLARLAMMLPQAIEQTGKFFDDLDGRGRVGVDSYGQSSGYTLSQMRADVEAGLTNAADLARQLRDNLARAQAALASATYVGG